MFKFSEMTPQDKATIMEHLEDLRKALLVSIIAIVIAAIACFFYSNQILAILQEPLTSLGLKLNYTDVTEPFFVQLKVALIAGLVIAFPIVMWQVWKFIAPALYPKERKTVVILFPIIIILFLGGVAFSYFGLLKLILLFFVQTAPSLQAVITINNYLSFVLAFTIPFGVVFELPVVVYFLTRLGLITPEWLSRNRKYALLIIFVLSAILTPGGNPIPQILMALPVYFLYEISILVSKLSRPKKIEDQDNADNGGDESAEAKV
ncbi:MAG: twin-arginine translocase subunit TatC [Chitinophagales bacterium]